MANAHVNMNFKCVPRENQAERWWKQLYGLGPEPEDHLIAARKQYVLEGPLGDAPVPENQDIMNAWQSRADDYSLVQCGMLYSLEPGLQKRFEQHGAYEMFEELKMVFQDHARVERYEVSDKFFQL